MAFGKRKTEILGNSAAASNPSAKVPLTSADFVERIKSLKDHVERVMNEASMLACAVKDGERIDSSGFSRDLDTDSFPLPISGFSRHFNYMRDGKIAHAVFAFQQPANTIDTTAQLHFFELATAATRLNAMCWNAHVEGALSIALQSHTAGMEIDRIIVLAGFLAAVLDNLIAVEISMRAGGTRITDETAQQRLAEWGRRSLLAMIDKSAFEQLCPNNEWSIWVVEMVVEDHLGQLVVNHVYLPKELATPVRQTMIREQAKAQA